MTTRAKSLLVVVASIALSLALVELACFLWLPLHRLDVFTGLVPDAVVVGTKRGHSAEWKAPEFTVQVRLNAAGYREDFDFRLEELEVAFMGDSFAFGQGVEAAERFSNVFASRFPERRIASLSYPNGWQPEHYEYFLRRNPALRPRLLVAGLYLGNDLDSDVKETAVRFDSRGDVASIALPNREIFDGYMVTSGLYPFGLGTLARHSHAVRVLLAVLNTSARWRAYLVARSPGRHPPNAPNTLETDLGKLDAFAMRALESLKRTQALVAERGGRLVVLVIPQNFYVAATRNPHIARENRDRIGEIVRSGGLKAAVLGYCEREKLRCVDATPLLAAGDYFELDAHWTPSGHRKVGLALAGMLEGAF